ncbi:hypothetical protein B296_00037825 [Ensete ventricosum]|uniref:Uncharacterized protein n=1 Tax=Ensete ventricosum TaxID=4639 RepID=A0A426ZY76_ENSVE|nr:hypothetical protein B296_00037825 [Ensete ventricosum]
MWSIQLQLKCFENSKQLMGNPLATCSEEAVNKQKGRPGQQTAGESEGKKKKKKRYGVHRMSSLWWTTDHHRRLTR